MGSASSRCDPFGASSHLRQRGQRVLCLRAAVSQCIDAIDGLPVAVLVCVLLILPHGHLR